MILIVNMFVYLQGRGSILCTTHSLLFKRPQLFRKADGLVSVFP